jgi:hypothetical protein
MRGALLAALALVSCTQPAPRPRYGEVMAEVARRFERAGRAAVAGRFELADFEVGELGELLTRDLARAELPQEGPTAHLGALGDKFLRTALPPLATAAKARSAPDFTLAFGVASAQCNACHADSQKGFIEVPSTPGAEVPLLTPVVAK